MGDRMFEESPTLELLMTMLKTWHYDEARLELVGRESSGILHAERARRTIPQPSRVTRQKLERDSRSQSKEDVACSFPFVTQVCHH